MPASPASNRSTDCCAKAGPEFLDRPWTPHRPPRPEKSEGGRRFVIKSEFEPQGDQPQAIAELVEGVQRNERTQVLLGVTGSGKTFTMAKVIEETQRPALILAPNKTLAAQLYGEFKTFFPDNAVEYFVSYYDYYQPEAYVPRTDTYIEKESSINEQIDRMRHSATRALLERDDVIIVASVSCIYGIGSVETYSAMTFSLKRGERIDQRAAARRPGRAAIQAHGRRFRPRLVPRARRHDRDLSRPLRGPRLARVAVRRRDRSDRRIRSADRPEDRRARIREDLRQLALCDAAADAASRRSTASSTSCASGSTSSTPPGSCSKRSGSSSARIFDLEMMEATGQLRRHRELFALSHRPQARRAAADPVRIPARQCAGLRRREPRHRAADRRHVSRRLPPQGDARRIRLPPALLHGQPAAQLRGMGRDAAADDLRLGHARSVGDQRSRRRLHRAGDPPDRPDRPAGRCAPGAHAGRRPHRRGARRWRRRATARWSPR